MVKEEEREFRQIWTSQREKVKYTLYKKDHKARTPDDVIEELVKLFWKDGKKE